MISTLVCFSASVTIGFAGVEPMDPNLVVNASFEERTPEAALPAGWGGPTPVFSVDTTVSRTGKASLKYVNPDAGRYCLASQKVPLRPGWKYRFSVWVKTTDIAGPETGATICIEWQDKEGKWLGGSYPAGIKGTQDWTPVEGITRVPKEAASFSLTCYVRKQMTGTAWFDDVELVRVVDPPMRTVLLWPTYRGRITTDGPDRVRARVRFALTDYEVKPKDLQVHYRLRDEAGNDVVPETSVRPSGRPLDPVDLVFATPKLAAGRYDLEIRLVGADGRELQTTHHQLVRMADDFKPTCSIDAHRRLLVEGEPFFPIGMYWSSINEEDIKVYAQSKFNCLMPYGSPSQDQMDLAHRYGLKVIYSIKDYYAGSHYCLKSIKTPADEEPAVRSRVRQYRDHPALLAWYLNDELSQTYMPRLEAHQRWVAEDDPNHPTWVVLYQYREVAAYLNTFDVIGTDPYPIGRKPASMAAEWTAETFRQTEGARPMWQVPQLHNWGNYRKTEEEKKQGRTPTFDEKRSMAWQCITEGATGLIFYSWYDVKRNPDVSFEKQWEGLKKIAAEIDSMAPVLLSVESAPEVKVRYHTTGPDGPRWLHWLVRSHEGKLYVFAANDGDGEGRVTFTLPSAGRSIRVLDEDRTIRAEGPSFQDESKKLSVHVYEIELAPQDQTPAIFSPHNVHLPSLTLNTSTE